MPVLKLVALVLLVLILGLPAASAAPEDACETQDPSPRLNLDYLAPEVRSVFGPDTYLAAPYWHARPLDEPDQCKRHCDLMRLNGEASCRLDDALNGDEYGFSLADCLRDLDRRMQGCEGRCGKRSA